MKRKIRERLSYANVMATLAVFIALGGTSYALTLPRDSVGPEQLRANSVGRGDSAQRDGSSEIDDRSVRLRDISKSAQARFKARLDRGGRKARRA